MKTVIALNAKENEDKLKKITDQDHKVNLNDLLKRKKHQDHLKKITNVKIFIIAFIAAGIILVTINL